MEPPDPHEVEANLHRAEAALAPLGILDFYNPLLYSCRTGSSIQIARGKTLDKNQEKQMEQWPALVHNRQNTSSTQYKAKSNAASAYPSRGGDVPLLSTPSCISITQRLLHYIHRVAPARCALQEPVTCNKRAAGSAQSSTEGVPRIPEQKRAPFAPPASKQRCLTQNITQQPYKPQQICTLFRSAFTPPPDAALRGIQNKRKR